MYILDLVSVSNGLSKDGKPFSIYRVFYKDSAKRGFFSSFYDNSPVIVNGETLTFSDAMALLVPGSKFVIYNGLNNSQVFSFVEV